MEAGLGASQETQGWKVLVWRKTACVYKRVALCVFPLFTAKHTDVSQTDLLTMIIKISSESFTPVAVSSHFYSSLFFFF